MLYNVGQVKKAHNPLNSYLVSNSDAVSHCDSCQEALLFFSRGRKCFVYLITYFFKQEILRLRLQKCKAKMAY